MSFASQQLTQQIYLSALRNHVTYAHSLHTIYSNAPANRIYTKLTMQTPTFTIKKCKNIFESGELKTAKYLQSIAKTRNLENLHMENNKFISYRRNGNQQNIELNQQNAFKSARFNKIKRITMNCSDFNMEKIHPFCNAITRKDYLHQEEEEVPYFKLFYYIDPRKQEKFNLEKCNSSKVTYLELQFHQLFKTLPKAMAPFILSFVNLNTFKITFRLSEDTDHVEKALQKLCKYEKLQHMQIRVYFSHECVHFLNEHIYLEALSRLKTFSREIVSSHLFTQSFDIENFENVLSNPSFNPNVDKLTYDSALFQLGNLLKNPLSILQKFTKLTHLVLIPHAQHNRSVLPLIDVLKSVTKVQTLQVLIINFENGQSQIVNRDKYEVSNEDDNELSELKQLKVLKFLGWQADQEQELIIEAFNKVFSHVEDFTLHSNVVSGQYLLKRMKDQLKRVTYIYTSLLSSQNFIQICETMRDTKNLEYFNIVSFIDLESSKQFNECRDNLLKDKPNLEYIQEWSKYEYKQAWDNFFCPQTFFGTFK